MIDWPVHRKLHPRALTTRLRALVEFQRSVIMSTPILLGLIMAVVVALPAEKDPTLESGINELVKSISKIQERVKGMRGIASGNSTDKDWEEVKEGINSVTRNVTYEDLITRVQDASKKVKDLQQTVGGTLKLLSKEYPRPSDSGKKPEDL